MFVIDVGSIWQEHISKRPPVLVLAVNLERDILAEDQRGRGLLRLLELLNQGLLLSPSPLAEARHDFLNPVAVSLIP